MLLGSYPRLLVLALSLPDVSHALGLGNLRVDSKLDQPLLAQIEIIGATPEELKAISASVAKQETFQRYKAERPAFLSSTTISVGTDPIGQPVLNIRSTDAFTEPLVELLIDVRWGKDELVRDYSLLLDPAPSAPALSASVAPIVIDVTAPLEPAPALDIPNIVLSPRAFSSAAPAQIVIATDLAAANTEAQHRVVAHDTLHRIARHAGARSEAEQQRMMLAIYRANPEAFAGNINRLHEGALIKIPLAAQMQDFDSAEVAREIRAQMAAWRRGGRPNSRRSVEPLALSPVELAVARAPVRQEAGASAVVSAMNKLDGQMQLLQQTLGETSRQLESANARIAAMEQRARQITPAPRKPAAAPLSAASGKMPLSALVWGMMALLAGGLAYARKPFLALRPRSRVSAEESTVEAPTVDFPVLYAAGPVIDTLALHHKTLVGAELADAGATVELTQVVGSNLGGVDERARGAGEDADTVVLVTLERMGADAPITALDYNLSDLDGRAQHVEMPGSLHDHAVAVERRKNVVDTLMAAIKRDPTRNDLRMKLLETLYAGAATNLRAFKEVVRDLARHPERIKGDEWEQIMMMGRQIAADDALFAESVAGENIAKRA